MGKGWKTAGKIANAQKKGQIFTKLAREIQVAAKAGGPDPESNSRLRMAIDEAKHHSCPNETIERAIKKGSGLLDDGKVIEELTYEGYGPHGVGVIVECQTDNKHRTAPEIRNVFKSHGGSLGESGAVAWMFSRIGYIEATKTGSFDPEEEAIEVGANEVEKIESGYGFYTAHDELTACREMLAQRGWNVTTAELSYKANNKTELNSAQITDLDKFLTDLDDLDDTHRIHSTM